MSCVRSEYLGFIVQNHNWVDVETSLEKKSKIGIWSLDPWHHVDKSTNRLIRDTTTPHHLLELGPFKRLQETTLQFHGQFRKKERKKRKEKKRKEKKRKEKKRKKERKRERKKERKKEKERVRSLSKGNCRIPLLNNSTMFYFNMLYYELVKYWNDTMAYKIVCTKMA